MKLLRGNKCIIILFCCTIAIGMAIFFCPKTIFAADDHLLINEIYPSPIDDGIDGEWIEIFNPTNDSVLLDDYFITDDEKTSNEADLSKFNNIPALSYLLIKKIEGDFSFILSNTDETIMLKKKMSGQLDQIVDQISYGNTTEYPQNAKAPTTGKSITRISGTEDSDIDNIDFVITNPTPGVEYQQVVDKFTDERLDIQEARKMGNGEDVMVTGIVTTLPGVLSSQYFYIQDESGGIQIYCYGKTFPALALGDSISVAGELSQTNNERRIKITGADKIFIQNHTEAILPAEIAISDIGENQEGAYIKTAGIVTETSGDTFYISDGQSDIKVVINKSTGIDKPKMKKGDQVEVTGIVSQYKDEYRILPIDQDDVKIVASEGELPRAGNDEFIYFIISLFLSVTWNIYLRVKKKPAT